MAGSTGDPRNIVKPAKSALEREPSPDESTQLLGNWHAEERLPFHDNRFLCLGYTERALAVLDDYAVLDITVSKARDLRALSMSNSLESPSAPYVSVLLDDSEVFSTQASTRPSRDCPVWSHKGSVPFLSPLSMVRLQVKDRDSISHEAEIGFVEFCLGDLPWATVVEGWLELRLQDRFEYTSWRRYRAHRSTADSQTPSDGSNARKRGVGSLFSCKCNREPMSFKGSSETAGEIHVKLSLRLRPECGRFDRLVALALDCPAPTNFGKSVHRSRLLPGYKIQDLGDNLTDLRFNVMENVVFSILYTMVYILQWRSFVLSSLVMAAAVAAWYNVAYGWVLAPGMLAMLLVLFACESLRLDMTTGGLNAPLSQQGFERVASWSSTPAMARFLRRLVEEDLQGKVVDEKKFYLCAAHCFANARPRVSFTQLRDYLKSAEFTSNCQEGLAGGARVLASGRRAVVSSFRGDKVEVEYEDKRGDTGTVPRESVVLRQQLPLIPEWALGTSLGVQIRTAQSITGQLNDVLGKVLSVMSGVFTWRQPCLSILVVLLLLGVAAGNAAVFGLEKGGHFCKSHSPCYPYAQRVVETVREVRGWVELALVVFVLIFQALWFTRVRSILKICARLLCVRRNAPSCWAFYQADGVKENP